MSVGLAACTPDRLNAIDLGQNTLSAGLVLHLTFDEGSGATVPDHSGNKRDGTVFDAGTWISDGKFAGALRLNGSGYVVVPNFPDATPSFSMAGWIRTADATSDAGLQTFASTEYVFDAGWEVNVYKRIDGGGLQAAYWNHDSGGYVHGDCDCLPSGVWTHFAFVVDAASHTLSVYENGQLAGVANAPAPIAPGTSALTLGAWSDPGRLLVGDIDDVSIYSRALAPAEVLALTITPPPDQRTSP